MQYTKGTLGRVFLVKFENNDDLVAQIKALSVKEKIRSAALVFLGAFRKGALVAGPKKPVIPPQPNRLTFKDGWEAMGVGTVFTNKSGPQVHIHTSMGRKDKTLTGCLREQSQVFLVIEAIVFELKGIAATKAIDPKTTINLLRILGK